MSMHSAEEKLLPSSPGVDDNFYDTSDVQSPDYDNTVNQRLPEDPEERARQEEEWREELAKLEDEIMTLRQVLSAKVQKASQLKRNLGITPMKEFTHDVKQGLQNIKESNAYVKTSETVHNVSEKISGSDAYQKTNAAFKTAGQKTATAFTTVGAFASRKLTDARNSTAFKSFEEKMGGAYTNVKTRVRGSQSEQNFEDVLSSSADEEQRATGGSMPTTPTTAPEDKVPL